MNANEFKKHLKTISPKGLVLSTVMKKTIAPLDLDEDDLGDLLGDAEDGDFDFVTFDEEEDAGFKKGYVPVAVIGHADEKRTIVQPEGLMIAQLTAGKVVRYLTVSIGGTLVPGTVKTFDADLDKLGLKPVK